MKKIVVALDGLKLSQSSMHYPIQLAKQCNAHLVGVFLDDITYTSFKIYDLVYEKGGLIGPARKKFEKKDTKTRAAAVKIFETACRKNSMKYALHHNRSFAIQELLLMKEIKLPLFIAHNK
jgi:hypothetical protein